MGGPKWDRGEVLNENPVLGGNSWIWGVDNTSGGGTGEGSCLSFPALCPTAHLCAPFPAERRGGRWLHRLHLRQLQRARG